MVRIATIVLPALVLFGGSSILQRPGEVICVPVPDRGDDPPQAEALARFCFNGDAKDETRNNPHFELNNTQFKNNALYLNGIYDGGNKNGYRAICKTPKLDYTQFTVAIRFKAEEFGQRKDNLFTGGIAYRWFGMSRSAAGNLTITLNNGRFAHEIKGAAIDPGKWIVIACGVDLGKRRIAVYVNGKEAADIELPKDFRLAIMDSDAKDRDKVWSFTNYSNANAFHGLVDELIIYGKMLSAKEFARIPLSP
jgi:hypothetical protein